MTYLAKTPDSQGHIEFTPEENSVWRDLMAQQLPSVQKYCARAYLDGLAKVDLARNRVPSADEVSARLQPLTGWRVHPVPAVIGFEPFFGLLSQRQFPAASFIRKRRDFDYIKEPDIFHELFGHTPLLTDPRFAALSQAIGAAGLRAQPKDYSWLIRLYWFTVEFGLTLEDGALKALGSGLASSPTELVYSVESTLPQRRAFDIQDILRTPYRIDIHQPVYFVLENLDDLFQIAERDLIADIRQAQALGLFAPLYEPKQKAS